jgi:5'-nucleotidase
MTLSINVPDLLIEDIEGFEITRLGSRHGAAPAIKQKDPRGRTIYWIGAAGNENDASEGTDFFAIKNGKVSITPLNVDLTSYPVFDEVINWGKAFIEHKEHHGK